MDLSIISNNNDVILSYATDDEKKRSIKEAKDLKLPRNIPLLVETRVIDDEKGNPIEFTKTAYAANRYVVDMRLGLLSTTAEPFKAAPIAPAKTSN